MCPANDGVSLGFVVAVFARLHVQSEPSGAILVNPIRSVLQR